MINEALGAAKILEEKGIEAEIIKLNRLDDGYYDCIKKSVSKTKRIIVLEECIENGCVGQNILSKLLQDRVEVLYGKLKNIKRGFVSHGSVAELLKLMSLDRDSLAKDAEDGVRNG